MSFWLVANWKMNLSWDQAQILVQSYQSLPLTSTLIVCPPHPWLISIQTIIAHHPYLRLGAQDCHTHASGAFTGSVSASMLKECGCSHVLIGHSERRAQYGEENMLLAQKIRSAHNAGLTPILCIGEKSSDDTLHTLKHQMEVLEQTEVSSPCFIAYEPVWAIGTGRTPDPQHIYKVRAFVQDWLVQRHRSLLPLLYGGSVHASNAASFKDVCDGLLVGGASLDIALFEPLVASL